MKSTASPTAGTFRVRAPLQTWQVDIESHIRHGIGKRAQKKKLADISKDVPDPTNVWLQLLIV